METIHMSVACNWMFESIVTAWNCSGCFCRCDRFVKLWLFFSPSTRWSVSSCSWLILQFCT